MARHRWVGRILILSATLALAGCGGDAPPATPPAAAPTAAPTAAGPYGPQDVTFLQVLANHHRLGIAMARIGSDRAGNEELRNLASAISITQSDEIGQIERWLAARNQPVRTDAVYNPHAAHGAEPGATQAQVDALVDEPSATFDSAFLGLMIGHQQNAVEMARTELATGQDRWVEEYASTIEKSRMVQISEMIRLSAAHPDSG